MKLLIPEEAARRLGIEMKYLCLLMNHHLLPYAAFGPKCFRFKVEEVDEIGQELKEVFGSVGTFCEIRAAAFKKSGRRKSGRRKSSVPLKERQMKHNLKSYWKKKFGKDVPLEEPAIKEFIEAKIVLNMLKKSLKEKKNG